MTMTSEENMRAAHPVRAYFHKEMIYSVILFSSFLQVYGMRKNSEKFGVSKIFNVLKEVSSAHKGCIYLIKNTIKSVKLWNIITI